MEMMKTGLIGFYRIASPHNQVLSETTLAKGGTQSEEKAHYNVSHSSEMSWPQKLK